mmetsp:Transcript_97603/g.260497  ORF Transcript_97603/g.260497 Transcript_97603/m.260497 type:complete len:235 (-) Transcript_97603:3113-3817(-)
MKNVSTLSDCGGQQGPWTAAGVPCWPPYSSRMHACTEHPSLTRLRGHRPASCPRLGCPGEEGGGRTPTSTYAVPLPSSTISTSRGLRTVHSAGHRSPGTPRGLSGRVVAGRGAQAGRGRGYALTPAYTHAIPLPNSTISTSPDLRTGPSAGQLGRRAQVDRGGTPTHTHAATRPNSTISTSPGLRTGLASDVAPLTGDESPDPHVESVLPCEVVRCRGLSGTADGGRLAAAVAR